MEQVTFLIKEQEDINGDRSSPSIPNRPSNNDLNSHLDNRNINTSSASSNSLLTGTTNNVIDNDGPIQISALYLDLPKLTSKQNLQFEQEHNHDNLDFALKLSSSYFYREDIEAHNEAAFYTISTQSLAICQLRENVSHRLRILYNLALYYYTKTAPQLKYLKSLEDVLELSPKQRSIATYYNNLAFMRLSAAILETENREALQPFQTNTTGKSSNLEPVFTTTEIELLVALNQLDAAFETNECFSNTICKNTTVHHAYYALHNYLIFQASGNHIKAKLNLEDALQSFEQTECNRSLATCHHYFSELYENLGYYTKALEHIKSANRFEVKSKAKSLNLSELERLHFQFRKKIVQRKTIKAQNLN